MSEAVPPAVPPRARRNWLKIALIVSLAFNALVVGVIVRSIACSEPHRHRCRARRLSGDWRIGSSQPPWPAMEFRRSCRRQRCVRVAR